MSEIIYFFLKTYQKRTSDIYRGNMDIIIKKNIYTFQDLTAPTGKPVGAVRRQLLEASSDNWRWKSQINIDKANH